MKRIITLSILVSLLQTAAVAGGGWIQPKNQGYFKLSQFGILADQYFAPSGEVIDITTTGIYNSSLYAEYGITNHFTAILNFPFFSRATLNKRETPDGDLIAEGDYLNSIGDTDLTLKYGFFQNKNIVMSASLTLGLPLGENSGGRTELLQTGDGEFNQMITLEASKSFYPAPFYASALIGFNHRTNNFSNELRYGLEVGYTPGKFFGILRFYGVKPFKNNNQEAIPFNGIFNNNVEYLSITPQIGYNFNEHWGVSASAGGAFYGKNILAAPSFTMGIFMKL